MDIFILLAAGLVALVFGGDYLVKGAVGVAERFGLSPLLIGLTLVGFGTSAPELVTSLQAAFAGAPGVAVGNVVGSNIANILLILGAAALISPIAVEKRTFARDGIALAVASLLCLGAVLVGSLNAVAGIVFLATLIAYLTFCVLRERGSAEPAEAGTAPNIWGSVIRFILGLVVTILGARWLVTGAIQAAETLGVSDTIIGLTVVAIGTSLPELVTSITAALRKQSAIAFGNVIGSNIFNVLFILGATAIIKPIAIPPSIAVVDIWVMLASAAALILVAWTGWRITRAEAAGLLAAYAVYIGWLVIQATA